MGGESKKKKGNIYYHSRRVRKWNQRLIALMIQRIVNLFKIQRMIQRIVNLFKSVGNGRCYGLRNLKGTQDWESWRG